MKIGIIGAMEEEIILLRNIITNRKTRFIGGCKLYTGILNDTKISLLQSGIGKVAAAQGITLLLQINQPDIIINIGSAGALSSICKVGDIVISNETRYHDVDVTMFGYKHGQIPNCPSSFKTDDNLILAAESCISEIDLNPIHHGLIVSGDTFINNSVQLEKIRKNFPKAIAVEMESAAIAHVCYNFKVPFISVRAISDVVDKKSHLRFKEFLDVSTKQFTILVIALVKKLGRI